MARWTIATAVVLATAACAWAQEEKKVELKAQVTKTTGSDDFTIARRWQKSSDLIGKSVKNSANEDLGKIEDIVVDANNGRILYGVLSYGAIVGKFFAVPWESFDMPEDAKVLVLNVDKARLETAEGFDKEHWPNFADETWVVKTYAHYHHKPYWLASDVSTDKDEARKAIRTRWYKRATLWQKVSDLSGKEAKNRTGESLGTVEDFAVDPDGGRLLYGILTYGGKKFAIPYGAFEMSSDVSHFVLNCTKEQLNDKVAFDDANWPNMTDRTWTRTVHTHYNVTPYWIEDDMPIERRDTP